MHQAQAQVKVAVVIARQAVVSVQQSVALPQPAQLIQSWQAGETRVYSAGRYEQESDQNGFFTINTKRALEGCAATGG